MMDSLMMFMQQYSGALEIIGLIFLVYCLIGVLAGLISIVVAMIKPTNDSFLVKLTGIIVIAMFWPVVVLIIIEDCLTG